MRKAVLLLILGLGISSAAGTTLDATVVDDCPAEYESVISLSSPSEKYGHPAPPDFFDKNLCVKGIVSTGIGDACQENAAFYLSAKNAEYAHFSKFSSYRVPVCTGRMITQVRDSCSGNQTALLSVSGDNNAHVAAPGVFGKQLCGYYSEPENVTLSLEFNLSSSDTVYADDQTIGEESLRLAEYPYIVSEGGGAVSGIVAPGMVRLERELEQRNRLIMERSEGSFFLPFTEGGYSVVEDDQEEVLERRFLDQLEPSFSFFRPEDPLVKTILSPNITFVSDLSIRTGTHELEITKTAENTVRIEER